MILDKAANFDDETFKVFLLSYTHPELGLDNLARILDMPRHKVYYRLEKIQQAMRDLDYKELKRIRKIENEIAKDIKQEMLKDYLELPDKKGGIKKIFEKFNVVYNRKNYDAFRKYVEYNKKKFNFSTQDNV